MNNARYTVTIAVLDQLILYLLTATPPPKPVWVILERVMNNLMQDHEIHALDVEELGKFRAKCLEAATPLLETDKELTVRTDSEEFQGLFNYYLVTVVLALATASKEEDKTLSSQQLVTAFTTSHLMHELVAPTLRALVKDYFELKHKAANG